MTNELTGDALKAEIEALKHDNEQLVAIASDLATELAAKDRVIERLLDFTNSIENWHNIHISASWKEKYMNAQKRLDAIILWKQQALVEVEEINTKGDGNV